MFSVVVVLFEHKISVNSQALLIASMEFLLLPGWVQGNKDDFLGLLLKCNFK